MEMTKLTFKTNKKIRLKRAVLTVISTRKTHIAPTNTLIALKYDNPSTLVAGSEQLAIVTELNTRNDVSCKK